MRDIAPVYNNMPVPNPVRQRKITIIHNAVSGLYNKPRTRKLNHFSSKMGMPPSTKYLYTKTMTIPGIMVGINNSTLNTLLNVRFLYR